MVGNSATIEQSGRVWRYRLGVMSSLQPQHPYDDLFTLDTAVEESRIGGVASFSPCQSILRGELPKRGDLRVLLAHGAADAVCPVEESRSLARTLDDAHEPALYVEFNGPHTIPIEVVRVLERFATAP